MARRAHMLTRGPLLVWDGVDLGHQSIYSGDKRRQHFKGGGSGSSREVFYRDDNRPGRIFFILEIR